MEQSTVDAVIRGLKRRRQHCLLPAGFPVKQLYPALDADPVSAPIRVTNEVRAPASAAGCFCPARRPALMENSGRAHRSSFGRMAGAGIPVVMLMSYRGELGEKQLVGDSTRHHHGAGAGCAADSVSGGAGGRQIERAIADAYAWSYGSYYHSAVALGGELVR